MHLDDFDQININFVKLYFSHHHTFLERKTTKPPHENNRSVILEQNNFAFSSDIDMASQPENTKKEFENLAEVEVHDAQVNSEPTQKTLTIEPAFENSIKEDKDFQVD